MVSEHRSSGLRFARAESMPQPRQCSCSRTMRCRTRVTIGWRAAPAETPLEVIPATGNF
jgi:hypothetical protein